jgi:hypothetical protein
LLRFQGSKVLIAIERRQETRFPALPLGLLRPDYASLI